MKPEYTKDAVYKTLSEWIESAGVKIIYCSVPSDCIDGEIWARADRDSRCIMMPVENDAFPDSWAAACVLGHEMGHILTGLDRPDDERREHNEAVCDAVGVALAEFSGMRYERKCEKRLFGRG